MRDPWLPSGFTLPRGAARRLLCAGARWQIYETADGGRALVARPDLAARWAGAGLAPEGAFAACRFGADPFAALASDPSQVLAPLAECPSPKGVDMLHAFADAYAATRRADTASPLAGALWVERLTRLLPDPDAPAGPGDDVLLGTFMSGGVPVSVRDFDRLAGLMTWTDSATLLSVLGRAGLALDGLPGGGRPAVPGGGGRPAAKRGRFELAGRPALEAFFNEHVVDLLEHPDRYRRLGIDFPGAIVLHGPPGCGKTYAVERLVEHLGLPSFEISSASIGSPFIHETSRKVADVFDRAIAAAPSALVIDEMEAFLADRERGSGGSHHRVEEVAEFLRRIPEATRNRVLVVAMTNRIDMIDPAVMRRGRFDHVIRVDLATAGEIEALLAKLLAGLPAAGDVEVGALARRLEGRPLSDAAFVVREAARLAARAGKEAIDRASLAAALEAAPARSGDGRGNRIGFSVED